MTDQGRIDLHSDYVRSVCNRYRILRKELHTALLEMKLIGDECRSVYVSLLEEINLVSNNRTKEELSGLLLVLRELRTMDQTGGALRLPGEQNWLRDIMKETLNELRHLQPKGECA